MAFFKNRIVTLDELLNLTFDGKGPDEFSFFGIIDKQTSEIDEKHPNLVHHDLILHDGSGARLHVQYLSGYDDETQYDENILIIHTCHSYPQKAWTTSAERHGEEVLFKLSVTPVPTCLLSTWGPSPSN